MRRNEERIMLDELADCSSKLSEWEEDFVESLTDRLDRGDLLTDRQRRKLADIYEEKVLGY